MSSASLKIIHSSFPENLIFTKIASYSNYCPIFDVVALPGLLHK